MYIINIYINYIHICNVTKNIISYKMRAMNPITTIWFWLLILSIIGFIIGLIGFETSGETTGNNTTTPAWIWVILILSLIFFIIAFILYIVDLAAYNRCMEIAEACGELPPPEPKKKIVCPKIECVENKVVECKEVKPHKTCDDSPKSPTEIQISPSTPEKEAFSAANIKLKPLESLSPLPQN